jgi:hypothetical protein
LRDSAPSRIEKARVFDRSKARVRGFGGPDTVDYKQLHVWIAGGSLF